MIITLFICYYNTISTLHMPRRSYQAMPLSAAPQRMAGIIGGEVRTLLLPGPASEVLPGLLWGDATEFFTPAFWAVQAWQLNTDSAPGSQRLGNTFSEEVSACLLGGHGLPAEIGLAAFARLRGRGLLRPGCTDEPTLYAALKEPLVVRKRTVHYRFARQKAKYLAAALSALAHSPVPDIAGGRKLRDWLMMLPGIGPKTASWIVRNWLDSNEVAILDIHIYRAGLLTGIFLETEQISRDYEEMERKFLNFAWGIAVRPSHLDAVIWRQMKEMGHFPISLLNGANASLREASLQP